MHFSREKEIENKRFLCKKIRIGYMGSHTPNAYVAKRYAGVDDSTNRGIFFGSAPVRLAFNKICQPRNLPSRIHMHIKLHRRNYWQWNYGETKCKDFQQMRIKYLNPIKSEYFLKHPARLKFHRADIRAKINPCERRRITFLGQRCNANFVWKCSWAQWFKKAAWLRF